MRSFHRILAGVTITCGALLCGCATPLGPGYTVKKQQYIVSWKGAGELSLRSEYRLENTGNQPLDYIEVTLPSQPPPCTLQVWLDQSPVSVEATTETITTADVPGGTVRIPFSPPLPQKQKRDVAIEHCFASPVSDVSAIPSFYLETKGWYPVLRERKGLFGGGGEPPEKWDLRITVPRDFLVHASGQRKGKKGRGGRVEHRFRQRTGRDFDPFVIAGRYQEHSVTRHGQKVRLWTWGLEQRDTMSTLAERLAATVAYYESELGPMTPGSHETLAIRLSKPADPTKVNSAETARGHSAFPGGIFLPWPGFSQATGIREECLADWYLAQVWLEHLARPDSSTNLFLNALSSFMAETAPAGCGFDFAARALRIKADRRELISHLLRGHARRFRPGASLSELEKWLEGSIRGQLFVYSLEDRVGRHKLDSALKRMLQSLRGHTWTRNDLRVAIHLETGEDPAEFFRQWLNQPGIPEEFRKKYEKQVTGSR